MDNWRVIDDTKLRAVWRCPDCDIQAEVEPWWYQNNGTPVCPDCDDDMKYLGMEQYNG